MRTSLRYFVFLLTVILLPTLTGCGGSVQSEGSVALLDDAGTPHSFAGATATLFRLNSAVVTPGQIPTPIGTGTVEDDGTSVTVKARKSAIRNARLYLVEIRCPANVPDDACVVNTPLHAVLSGAQFRAGNWQATVLTETAYQNATYTVAVSYAATEIRQALDNAAAALLAAPAPGTAADYTDLLAWNPADTTAVKRPGQLADFVAALVAGISHNTVQVEAQQLTNLLVGALALDSYVQDVALAGERAYLVGSTNDLPGVMHVVDISDPSHPLLTATLGDLGKADALQLAGMWLTVETTGTITLPHCGSSVWPIRISRYRWRASRLPAEPPMWRLRAITLSFLNVAFTRAIPVSPDCRSSISAIRRHPCLWAAWRLRQAWFIWRCPPIAFTRQEMADCTPSTSAIRRHRHWPAAWRSITP